MTTLDQLVIGAYLVGMLAIGWYSSRGTTSTDDYLLGGRRMNPILVGLSLFATLLSSLSYLAVPGEIIGHGPFMMAQFLAYPITILMVGWGLIPFIMRQPVVSAYELLEQRLGTTIRLCAASIFLLLRLGWMAAILYVTCSTLLIELLGMGDAVFTIPMLGIETSAVPWLCLIMGLVTVTYAASGGFKAVVLTDATQCLIMICGAVGTIIVITHRIGFAGWFPDHWYGHWDPAETISWSNRSFLGAIASSLCWYVATAGADQMAVQRYLSTRNAGTARRTLMISMTTDLLVISLLALVGLAVYGFYRSQNPELANMQNLWTIADKFFPRFILEELPQGLRGLVIVAVLAAAMSSISSGINSSSAVLKEDVLSRFAFSRRWMNRPVLMVRSLSFAIGIMAILISLTLSLVPGNLIELSYKIVNLLSVPIFVLFFMALFVPWATPAGALAGLVASIAAAVAVAHFQVYNLSIYWMTPAAMVAGISTGTIASAIFRKRD